MVQYNKNIKNNKKGFTLVELMVVLAITAILAALVGGGLIAYTRLARFEKNEANARTLFQTAQISLTRMETAGELDAFRRQVMEEGDTGDHFQNDVTVTDVGGNTLVSRTKTELNQNVAALYYDRTGAAAGNHNALVERLLGDYIYDASLLNASICVEIDMQSGQVYSVFYDTKSDKLRFREAGATDIYDRSYDHRRNDSLVGYYSAEDRVNVVQLVQTKLKVKNPRLTNGETLTLSWSGNSSLGDLDTSYTATAYDAKDTDKTKPLFTITIKRDTAGAADDNKQVITKMPVTIYTYDNAGQRTETEKELYFPLSYNKGSFVLTLDAMADAALLRACENSADVAATSLYSITRLLNDPQDIYIAMRAEPRENYSDTYTASKEEPTNEENTLLAKGGTADKADLKYFRHLYNLRWSADWDITNKGIYTLTPQASNSTGLNWTGGGVTVYCAAGAWPTAKVPSLNDPVAWPTIPELGERSELTSKTAGVTTQTTRVPILNLQLSSKSVAKTGRAEQTELADHYVGLIGENKGKISYITLRDPDIQVNVKTETVAADTLPNENQLKLTATKFVTALAKDDENWRDVRAVGALCGVNTGTLENCALTRGTNTSTSALVAAALAFDNKTTATQRNAQTQKAGNKSYTYYTDEPRGIGGLVGVAIPKTESVMQNLTVASDVTVAGLLVDKGTQSVTKTTAPDQKAEKARYAAAAAGPNDENSLWRSVGVGGVFGTVDAAQMKTDSKTNIVNNGFVTGNGFTGGIVGNLFTTGANTSAPSLTGLRNNGTVSAGANYKGDTEGDARSLVLGQFFGGIAGYGRGVTLQGCESVTRSDLTETQLKEQVEAGFDKKTGTLTDASLLKGDFVGGLVGYGKDIMLNGCKTGKGYVLGSRFVGGLAGGFTGSGVQQNDTNSSDVFGSRYVGGIVSVNGSNSQISGMTNTGLVAAFGKNAAYVGGIVGVNDADWGGSQDPKTATVQNCANRMSGDNATDTRRINLLKELSSSAGGYADYVGGIAGCNGKNSVVTWDGNGTPTLGAILYGNNYVGGVAGYNDVNAKISNTSGQNLTISGQIVAAGKAVGGMIGLNCASTLPSATVKVSRVAGQQLVGGVIGANLPVGRFTVTGGAFNTDVASGRVEADAVAGGIIGYNRLLKDKPANVTLAALLPKIDESTGVLTDSTDAQTETDTPITLTDFWNKLNLQADIYVGGIVGANDAKTKLTIQKAANGAMQNALSVGGLNPSNGAFKGGVLLSELAGDRYVFDTPRGALAGGIIGYATPNTKLENCTNYGTVAHKCAAGGFAGWNEGTITGGSMAASLGNRETGYTYLGGVAGVNGGLIQSAYPAQGCAVRGDSYVGGIAGVNLGGDATASKGLIICTENNSTGTVEANQYAGGVAGANVGNISLSGQLQSSVTATGYAGGVAGINTDKGRIYGTENATGAVRGSVTAANYAGGVAGTNSAEITRVENRASVRASTKYAGGIAGENAAGGKISACVHARNQVYATNGEAGGIAGNNNSGASIENVQVSAAVTAANGTAGGVTATNFGIIGQGSGLESSSSVSGCTITGTSESIGAIAAYNGQDATIRNVKLAANADVRFSTPAVTIGGLAGMNEGTVTGCQVENGALTLNDGLRAGTNTVTLGGAVGRTTEHGTVSSTNVLLDLTQNLDKYTNLGGVAGQNDGTLKQCTYSGTMGGDADTDGLVSDGARSTGSTVGGIAGLNNSKITGCEVKYIKLQVSGISNITTTQTADEKLASASHVGGIAGRNNDEIANSYVATERSSGSGSIITARYGFVGGVAGSNNGTITGSGSKKALVSDEEATPALVTQVDNWLGAADANVGINSMAAELTTGKTYAGLKGVDTVTDKGYTNVYNNTGLAANDLLVALRGSNNSETVRAAGYLGGLAGFNSLRGTIGTSATGKWFVYSDNATTASTVGGIVGQNESNVTDKSVLDTVVNCAAVRRFTRVFDQSGNKDDTDNDNIYKSKNRVVVHVGGVIGQQQNRSDDRWSVSKVVNCGSVFNSRSANVGGVIAYWLDYGGTVQKCFNFGKMTTNTNDHDQQLGGYGAVGGIVGFIDQPISGGTTNVLSCRNYGQIWYESNGANDCAGIIGKIEMKQVTDIMTLNIIDCVNTNNDPNQADNFNTSAVQTFMHALPTPELEVRLVKRSEFNWDECKKVDGNEEFKYEQILVLKNYEDYPKDENWTVTVTRNGVTNPYTFSRQNGKKYIRIALSIGVTKTFTALATPAAGSTSYLRSAEYKVETYVPSQWRDKNTQDKKNEDGLPVGTLSKAENATEYVTCTGQSAENFTATVTFGFTPTLADPTHGSPTYRVMLLAKYLGNDTVNGQSLNGQYITLAAREGIVTETPVTFNLNSLPSDAMSNYTDFLVIAVPITSGKGDVTTRWDATPDEVSTAIASHASDTDKEIWWKNGYEIVRTGEHSYTYAHLTPLCFSDVSRTDNPEWATQATVTTPQIIFKQLNLNVLKAPTLAETIEDGVVDDKNQLTYTFNWTQDDMQATDAAPVYQIKLYGLLTDADGKVTGQEQIALKDTLPLTQNGNSFTLPVNVDAMLANGSDSWRYDKVRLEVTRVAAADTDEIGASAVADYSVKQRLPGISAPSSITRVNGETDNADALLYTVSWSPSDDERIDHYDLCAVDANGNTVLTLPTTGNVGSLTLDLEQYQGKALRFRVIARRKDDSCFDGPDGALSQPETIVSRAAAPKVTASSFAPASPNQETFLNDLKLNMTLEEAAQGNVYFTGYIFSNKDNYNTIANLAKAWQGEGAGEDKYTAQQELTKKLDEMLDSGDAELVIPKDSRTVGGSASVNDNTASYTFVPDGNGFTLTPDHAKQYLLPAVRVMPTDGRTASNWFYILQDAAKAQLPAITLDAPVDAAEPERALGNAVYKQEVNLYNDPEFAVERDKTSLELRRFTVEWTAVNKYTQADGTVRNLTDSYTFTVTPLDTLDKDKKQSYNITVTTYDRDVTGADGTVTHKRGEIKTVTKTYDGKKMVLKEQTDVVDKETGETRIWYDLSVEPVYDKDNNLTGWEPKPYNVTGTVEKDGGTLYYKAKTVPMLELVQEDGAEPVYRITLPELQEKVQDDSLALQKFTASVTLKTLAHSDDKGKTIESGMVKVPVNEANTADAAEDAQSIDSAESVAPAETAESTSAESAPASVPPVLMRARAALPMATPETAAAPDETDAAETAPSKQMQTSDAS